MYSEVLDRQTALAEWLTTRDGDAFLQHVGRRAMIKDEGGLDPQLAQSLGKGPAGLLQILIGCVHSEPYYWSAEMVRMLNELDRTLPSTTLTPEMLPTRSGFVHFDGPSNILGTEFGHVTGFAWSVTPWGVSVVTFVHMEERPGLPVPMAVFPWYYGSTHDCPLPPEKYIGDGDPRDDRSTMMLRQMFATMILLLNQKIVVHDVQRADRGARRRSKKAGLEGDAVRVIRLRTRLYEHKGEERSIEWTCRWMVRGHWRQQAYGPDKMYRRPTWILPYDKGPEGLPLRDPQKIFAMVQ